MLPTRFLIPSQRKNLKNEKISGMFGLAPSIRMMQKTLTMLCLSEKKEIFGKLVFTLLMSHIMLQRALSLTRRHKSGPHQYILSIEPFLCFLKDYVTISVHSVQMKRNWHIASSSYLTRKPT